MAYKKLLDYKKDGIYNYPNSDINPDLKANDDWYICHCQAMLNDYTNNRCEVPFEFGEKTSFETRLLYAQGRQGAKMIKKQLLSDKNFKGDLYKTKMRIGWNTYDILPEKIDVIQAINQRQNNEINASCTDYESVIEKEKQRNLLKYLLQRETQEFLEKTQYKPQTPIDTEALGIKSEADVDMFFDSGNFVMQHELAAIASCNKTKTESGYKTIENKCTYDLIVHAIAGVKDFIDEGTNTVKMRYANPRGAIIPFSEYNDFRDITRCAELREVSIAEVSEINPRLTVTQLCDMAKEFAYLPVNRPYLDRLGTIDPSLVGFGTNNNFTGEHNFISKCKVLIVDAQWLSVDHETYLKDKNRQTGTNVFKRVKYGYELNNQEIKKGVILKKTQVIKKYEAIWVIGSRILLKNGPVKDAVYYGANGGKTPRLDYYWAKTGVPSLVERCMPHVDDVNMNVIKLRNAVAMLPPAPRMVIRQAALDNVFLGKIRQQPDDLIQTMIERGYLVISDTDDHGNPIFQNGKAVDFINTNLAEDVNIFNTMITTSIARIAEVLGLPQGLDGSKPEQYTGLKKMELAADASSNALFPTLGKINDIFNPAFNGAVKMWQAIAQNKDLKLAYSPLGSTTKKVFELSGLFTSADFNIEITIGPNDDQKTALLMDVQELTKAYAQSGGTIGVSAAEYLMLYDLIMAGNIKLAQFKLAQIQTQRQADAKAKEAKDQAWNIKSQTVSSQTAEAERRTTSTVEESNKQKTAIVTETEQRKTAIITAYLKSKEVIDINEVTQLLQIADAEIAAAMMPQGETAPQEQQQDPSGMEQPQEQQMPPDLSNTPQMAQQIA